MLGVLASGFRGDQKTSYPTVMMANATLTSRSDNTVEEDR